MDIPGVLVGQRDGWYLIAANNRVEAGPFDSEEQAVDGAYFLEVVSGGVHPSPWFPRFSRTGLQVGSRWRATRPARQVAV